MGRTETDSQILLTTALQLTGKETQTKLHGLEWWLRNKTHVAHGMAVGK
jgi:hypothetical protein